MDWFLQPFEAAFMQRALAAGVFTAALCAVVGVWVVLRGLSFMGDALAHGVIPGIAAAYLLEASLALGAAAGAAVMVAGVGVVSRRGRVSEDTSIGLLFVGMLALGVLIISRAGSFAVDLTSFLFGDILGVTATDVRNQAVALAVVLLATLVGHRAFLALAFDERKAAVLGLAPRIAHFALLGLVGLVVVVSFGAVGSLLVFGLLVGPAATASLVAKRVPVMALIAVLSGAAAVALGLVFSYQWDLAGGAAMSATAVGQFFVVLAVQESADRMRSLFRRRAPSSA